MRRAVSLGIPNLCPIAFSKRQTSFLGVTFFLDGQDMPTGLFSGAAGRAMAQSAKTRHDGSLTAKHLLSLFSQSHVQEVSIMKPIVELTGNTLPGVVK